MWIPPEIKDPVLLYAPTRNSGGYFLGAVRLRDGRFVFRLETGTFNGPGFLRFLRQLRSARRGPSLGDGWQSSPTMPDITIPSCIAAGGNKRHHFALDFPAPYRPELNPIERVWTLTHRRCLHNRYFENLKDVISRPLNPSSRAGRLATTSTADYAIP